jgi:hypothetical protein
MRHDSTLSARPPINEQTPIDGPSARPDESFEPQAIWMGMRLLRLAGGDWPAGERFLPRQVLLQVAEAYDGEHPEALRALCQGFYLMAHRHYEPALREFEQVLGADASPTLQRIGELALEGHAFCLHRLDRPDEAGAELLYLLLGKLSQNDRRNEAELTAEIASLVRLLAEM